MRRFLLLIFLFWMFGRVVAFPNGKPDDLGEILYEIIDVDNVTTTTAPLLDSKETQDDEEKKHMQHSNRIRGFKANPILTATGVLGPTAETLTAEGGKERHEDSTAPWVFWLITAFFFILLGTVLSIWFRLPAVLSRLIWGEQRQQRDVEEPVVPEAIPLRLRGRNGQEAPLQYRGRHAARLLEQAQPLLGEDVPDEEPLEQDAQEAEEPENQEPQRDEAPPPPPAPPQPRRSLRIAQMMGEIQIDGDGEIV